MQAGCFVLLSNAPANLSAADLLRLYKEQNGIEKNFGFLKDTAIVNSLFLKSTERIEALGFVLLTSLLIWRLMERSMRTYVESEDRDLPGWKNRRTKRPTSFMLTTKFVNIIVLTTGSGRRLARPLWPDQLEYLEALDLSPDIFTSTK